jgi:predicted RNase H-like HicB family nuclease
MNTITFSYLITPEKKGFSVSCLDWNCVFSQGENIIECKKNIVEVTEMLLEDLINIRLVKSQYPKIKKHIANPYTFQLTFNLDKAKFLPDNKIPFKSKIKAISNIAAIF